MMMSRVLSVQIFFLILGNSFALDGCALISAWRCGDTCISRYAECKCGDEIFGREDQKWCCHNSCTGKGGKDSDGTRQGAECTGRAQNLTEACNQKCNFY